MKRYFILIVTILLLVCVSEAALAQAPLLFAPPNPFLFSLPTLGLFYPSLTFFPPLLPIGPFPSVISPPRTSLSLLSPPRMPQPLLRQAAATITIFFNPTLSVIQVTVLPITPLSPVAPIPAPVTAVAPTVAAPALGLTALALLPLLTGLTGPTQTKTLTRLATTPTVPVLTGITGLLPLI